jgi:hypothetical protein
VAGHPRLSARGFRAAGWQVGPVTDVIVTVATDEAFELAVQLLVDRW